MNKSNLDSKPIATRYSYEFPEGKVIEGKEIPEGFVDTPTKLGITRGMSADEVAEICKEGLNPTPSKVASIKKVVKKSAKKTIKKNSLSK